MPSKIDYREHMDSSSSVVNERGIEEAFVSKLPDLKYIERPDIRDRAALVHNFREKFEALNRVRLTDIEFARLLNEIVSPKVYTLLKENDHIHKCVFVVDRKGVDRQTQEEFNKFQEGCIEGNTNIAAFVRRLLSEDCADKVIVTTIQKLGFALNKSSKRTKQWKKNDQPTYKEMLAPLNDKRIVFIFDEGYSSQLGENHKAIKEFFPKVQLFGCTCTQIFEASTSLLKMLDTQTSMRTSTDLFLKKLHAYTIIHAIQSPLQHAA